jgi:FMN phosphatase YigB (HAD superfamily)
VHKAILFDLGRVLVHFDFQIGYRGLETACGVSAADIPRRLSPGGLVERFESGQVSPEAFFEEFQRTLGIQLPFEQFCEIWSSIFTHAILPESMLAGLRKRYRMVLLSNTNALHFVMIRQWYEHLLRHFDALILSHEVGAMKPDDKIFDAAVNAAGCRPEECFYTDDIERYVAAARTRGIDAVVFQSRAQLEEELHKRGITWE